MPKRRVLLGASSLNKTSAGIPTDTDLSAARATIVNELWRALNDGKDPEAGSAAAIMANFEEQRFPQVLQGQLTAAEMEAQAIAELTSNNSTDADATISKVDFFNFHSNFLSGYPEHTDREVTLLLRWLWKQDQPDPKFRTMNKTQLASLTKELFASSAYRGQKFQEQPLNDDKVNTNLGTESMSKLDPFPMPKPGILPKQLEGHFYSGTTILHHKTHCLRNGEEAVKNHPPFTGEPHRTGAVATNPKSVGFIDAESQNRGYGTGQLDDAVIDAVNRGKQIEDEAARRRLEVLSQPFTTADPPHFKSTAQLEHLDFSRVIDRRDKPVLSSGKEWTAHTQQIRGPRGLRPAGDGNTAPDALPRELIEQQEQLVQRNSLARRPHPKFDATTTQREHFAPLEFNEAVGSNDRWASKPTPHAAQRALAESLVAPGTDFVPRHGGEKRYGSLETEYSAQLKNPGRNPDFSTKHHHPNVLDLKNGTAQMKTKWHHPRDQPLGDSVPELRAATVVPRQFATTTRHFAQNDKY